VREVRRYVAPDLRGAERQLEAELPEFAARGLRATWRVWFGAPVAARSDGRGELIVQFDAQPERRGTAAAKLPPLATDERLSLMSLVVELRELLRLYRVALRALAVHPDADVRLRSSADPPLRRVESMLRTLEARLDQIQRTGR
jgi:hypothetical protein